MSYLQGAVGGFRFEAVSKELKAKLSYPKSCNIELLLTLYFLRIGGNFAWPERGSLVMYLFAITLPSV